MQSTIKKTIQKVSFYLLGFALSGCSSANNEMAGGNLQAINHTMHGINWMSVDGYRADGGGGSSCCIIMPVKWRPGLKAQIEWEVDPEPFGPTPPLGTDEFRAFMVKHKANYQRHNTTVDIPEWPGTERCGLKVHFLVCNQIKVTSSCWAFNSEHYPIKEPSQMKEPAVCPK
ncbi:DUF3304 domain-containing protein [Pseudomonas sp. TNT11]|uniref:DUF3304 domain-containing protein n=1 Tax=Pseudomonas emilianonis TaxID=2915812 RepID=A0ABT0EEZ1_9PSED|nr:DUF3304 domain-containing protein [Pseudomonas emilianonis]MCK1784044.1 DUF3304 domain-containing protein [Pseudomonas emilianonis]